MMIERGAYCSLYCLVLDSLWIILFKYEAQIPELSH